MRSDLELKLEKCQKEFDEFIYRVSHDLKAPLRTILGFSSLLARDAGERLQPHEKQELDMVLAAAQQAQQLLDSILAYGRLAKMEYKPAPVDLNALVKEVLTNLGKNNNAVSYKSLPTIMADATMLSMVLTRVLDNAFKFVKPGQNAAIAVTAERVGEEWVIAVEDDGIGIPAKHHDAIFEIFRKLNGDEYKGLGDGLAVAKRLMECQGGRIGVETLPEGSRFTITLPAKPPV